MRTSIVAVVAMLSSLAASQATVGSLPKCGQQCFGNNFAGCGQFDYKCICGNKDLIAELSCCVSKTCDSNDQNAIITLASALCKAAGVDVPTQASCAAGASSSSASSSSASSSSNSASSASSSSSASSTGESSGAAASQTTSASQSPSATGETAGGSTGAAVPVATAGAGLGLAVAAMLAAL